MFVSDSRSPCSENGLVLLDGLYPLIFTVNTVLIQQNSIVCMNALMTFQVRMGYQHKIANVWKYGPNKGMIKFRVIKGNEYLRSSAKHMYLYFSLSMGEFSLGTRLLQPSVWSPD